MGFAGRVKRPLSEIAIIDQVAIGEIVELVIDNLPPGGYEHPATHPATMITEDTGHQFITSVQKNNIHAAGSDNQDISGKVDKETGKSLVADTEISKIHTSGSDNQDLSGLQPKETGKGLSTNDFTTADKSKLDGIENYVHPTNHGASIIIQDASNRFVSDTEKGTWNGKEPGNSNIQTHVTSVHAPVNAQKNSDITKPEIEAKLIGEVTSHSHADGGGGLNQQQIEGII